MVARLLDNCAVRVPTTGTGGTLDLGEPVQIARQFMLAFTDAGAVDGVEYAYKIVDGSGWEIAKGIWSATSNTIGRTTLKAHDGRAVSTSPLNLSGRAYLAVTLSADDFATLAQLQDNLDVVQASADAAAASAAAAATSAASKVVGPASSTAHRIAAFANASGLLLEDSGKLVSDFLLKAGDTLGAALNWAAAVTVASASTCDIGAAASNYVNISGAVTITSLGTAAAGAVRWVKFTGAPLLTYNATSLILPTAANITAAAGDTALFVSEGSGNWRCLGYSRASGLPLARSTWVTIASGSLSGTAVSLTSIPQTYTEIRLSLAGASHNGGSSESITFGVSANNGSTYSSQPICSALSASALVDIVVMFPKYTSSTSAIFSAWGIAQPSPTVYGTATTGNYTTTHTGGCNAILLALTGGASFDAGAYLLEAR